jgi:hypothetical protein
MDFKDFIKTTEALVVLIGLFLVISIGKFFAYITAIVYIILNVPALWVWIRDKFNL